MSLTTMVSAVATYFAPNPLTMPLLAAIYPHPPKITSEQEWSANFPPGVGTGSGAVVYIHIDQRRQRRIAPGPLNMSTGRYSGEKWAEATVSLMCFLRSKKKKSEDVGVDNFAFLDSLETQLLASRNLGTAPLVPGPYIPPGSGLIFQAGEGGQTGGDDIEITPGIPRIIDAQTVEVFSVMKFTIVEILQT